MTDKIIVDRYLGDGVSASFDGYHIVLDLRAQDSTTRIALEPKVLSALQAFERNIRKLNMTDKIVYDRHLGNDVYASFGGQHIILDLREQLALEEPIWTEIALGPEALRELWKFEQSVKELEGKATAPDGMTALTRHIEQGVAITVLRTETGDTVTTYKRLTHVQDKS